MDAGSRWKRWAVGLAYLWGLLFVIALGLSLIEQATSGFYHFDEHGILGTLFVLADALFVFVAYMALPSLGGILTFWVLIWIAAYVAVRWDELRARRRGRLG